MSADAEVYGVGERYYGNGDGDYGARRGCQCMEVGVEVGVVEVYGEVAGMVEVGEVAARGGGGRGGGRDGGGRRSGRSGGSRGGGWSGLSERGCGGDHPQQPSLILHLHLMEHLRPE